jgi:hypothetical protein
VARHGPTRGAGRWLGKDRGDWGVVGNLYSVSAWSRWARSGLGGARRLAFKQKVLVLVVGATGSAEAWDGVQRLVRARTLRAALIRRANGQASKEERFYADAGGWAPNAQIGWHGSQAVHQAWAHGTATEVSEMITIIKFIYQTKQTLTNLGMLHALDQRVCI